MLKFFSNICIKIKIIFNRTPLMIFRSKNKSTKNKRNDLLKLFYSLNTCFQMYRKQYCVVGNIN